MNELSYTSKKYAYEKYGHDNLLIVLNTHNQGSKYFGYATLTRNPKSDLLFITDPNNSYYLDNDDGKTYKELLIEISKKYATEKVTIFGTSMAGYAALFFGSQLGFNIILSNPQLDLQLTSDISWPNLRETISKIPNKIKLKEFIGDIYSGGAIYIIYGDHRIDLANFEIFNQIEFGQNIVIKKHIKSIEHGFFLEIESLFEIQKKLMSFEESIRYIIPKAYTRGH